ncbi:MAG: phosphoribosylformylglycinamidine synthase subunit PurQ [Acidimicrobiales bacterium]|nr:phosphoribosylformylglycinamidine synthase subunit PurQ [Acidimicrobiales bacterium]
MRPRVLIPVALGTNRDADLADAFRLAGADPESVPIAALRAGDRQMEDYQILAVPGGFSYGDALGAGRLLGLDLMGWFGDQLAAAAASGKPIFGVCNGFQALVRAGLLPGDGTATLTENGSDRFECRWVAMQPNPASVWTAELTEPLRCPVAHGEGQFVSADLGRIEKRNGVVLRYLGGGYPANPNGSVGDVAGVTDPTGMILGLMPHPENHIHDWQDPLRGRAPSGNCLPLFQAGVRAA